MFSPYFKKAENFKVPDREYQEKHQAYFDQAITVLMARYTPFTPLIMLLAVSTGTYLEQSWHRN